MNKVQVVAAVIKKGDRFLLGKRTLSSKHASGYWCCICGKIEKGESEEQAVIREVSEEIGIDIKPVRKISESPTNDGTGLIHWWLVEIENGMPTIKNDEHSELRWLSTFEMESLDLIYPEDIELYKTV